MKKSLQSHFRLLLFFFFLVSILESVLIFLAVRQTDNPQKLVSDTHLLVLLFLFIQFVFFVILYYYIPYQYSRAFEELKKIMKEISEGKYQFDLENRTAHQAREIADLMSALQDMMNVINRFDSLKTEKISEQHIRTQQLINMLPQGCLIMNITGEILYVNRVAAKFFPELTENLNILETYLTQTVETEFKPLLINSIKSGENLHNRKLGISELGITLNINSSIVKNRKNQPTGVIFLFVKA
ncbi:MAG TPA: hypothetical protein PKJ14_01210 [Candidatus Cloacimonadota bacterium]|nr:hypothetical protein [Candidatus Cloacimonadota bacterium]HQL15032.1 hypothetical protein [Candidatus Cloacimonadota bacterium]